MKNKSSYAERIVGFLDILGFKEIINKLEHNPDLHEQVLYALNKMKEYKTYSMSRKIKTALSKLEISVFSDSIAISSKVNNIFDVLWASGWIQSHLLYVGILVRGGISIGPTFHQKGILYGSGLVKAYEIESNIANYPRVVIDPVLLNKLTDQIKSVFTNTDSDGFCYIDPFKFAVNPPNATELANDGYDPREVYFNKVKKYIDEAIAGTENLNHLAKWRWLSNKLTDAMSLYLVKGKLPFDQIFDKMIKNAQKK
ncbi:hypothetical protein LPTSP3_g31300 [Leptospira kobayashii]|uniref:Uncharacterized protein n=1 Tax=Leptospira kobayashii TaxID=1917830 RepID=A0ABN6KHL1_9LEPT|nr:hypothetical protein [Leptospira kobayashii]BDA80200.1 hypothetical protein LPTSP3_g31300 [Leptospira kobayashii]